MHVDIVAEKAHKGVICSVAAVVRVCGVLDKHDGRFVHSCPKRPPRTANNAYTKWLITLDSCYWVRRRRSRSMTCILWKPVMYVVSAGFGWW